jgi:DNA repair protein RecO (recombination protein O)
MNGNFICSPCFEKALDRRIPLPDPHETGTANILLPVSAEALQVMRYILSAPSKRIFSFRLSGGEAAEHLSRITEAYLLHHLERSFDSLSFFHTMLQG